MHSLDGSPDTRISLSSCRQTSYSDLYPSRSPSKMRLWTGELGLAAAFALVTVAAGQGGDLDNLDFSRYQTDLLPHPFHSSAKQSPPPWYLQNIGDGDKDCPPCFNCMLPAFECKHFANCSEYDGKCKVRLPNHCFCRSHSRHVPQWTANVFPLLPSARQDLEETNANNLVSTYRRGIVQSPISN